MTAVLIASLTGIAAYLGIKWGEASAENVRLRGLVASLKRRLQGRED